VSRCDSKEAEAGEVSSKEENLSANAAQESFAKKQGQFGDVPDQIAIESHNEPVEHRGERRPFPLPFPMKGMTGAVVLPMPPGFSPQGHGPPVGIRLPGPGQHVGMSP